MLVFVQVSSINTSRAGSNIPCACIQRRRARTTSARCCSAACKVFFKADVAPIEEPPNRGAAARDSSFLRRRDDLVQRQVWLLGNQTQQEFCVILQRCSAAATRPCRKASGLFPALRPNHHHTGADPIALGCLTPRCSCRDLFDHPGTQVTRIRSWHCSTSKSNQGG